MQIDGEYSQRLENTVGKGEKECPPFPIKFSTLLIQISIIYVPFHLSSANTLNLDQSRIYLKILIMTW